jgi:hypothetical protein
MSWADDEVRGCLAGKGTFIIFHGGLLVPS